MSINRVIISGNLTRDPELRNTQSGMAVLSFGVAVNDRRKNPTTGEWEDYPNFVDCTMFGARADSLSRYLSKGTKVSIEGKLRWSQWERDGQKRSKLEVIVDELEFMSSRNANGGAQSYGGDAYGGNQGYSAPAPAYSAPAPAPAAPPAAPVVDASSSVYDDDIPF
ncbi:single-stranded DNA-binding protein [uncultured Adlercreutzia sp.]|uniref:single-stranded DNA-binding protein n=1 Tax=uncultured Adlercreutzia sp. TaxID=875803 RepID=UPI002676769C|nr:single-stranded DNA-binding protein [uncultured Adlercreutzia sp.]